MTKRKQLDVQNADEVILKKRYASLQREVDKLRLEMNQIETVLNLRITETYKNLRIVRLLDPTNLLPAIKSLRQNTDGCVEMNGFHNAYFGLKDAKDFCDELKAGQIKILKLTKTLTVEQIEGLKAFFEIEPVVGL